MPYTLPLIPVPQPLSPTARIAEPDGRPSREFVSKQREWDRWAERVQAALTELEPP